MKLTFKQYNAVAELSEDQVTEEALTEIFGQFFGGKPQADKDKAVADLKAKKAGVQSAIQKKTGAMTTNTQNLDKNKQWMDWVASQKNTGAPGKPVKKFDKLPSNQHNAATARAAERDWVASMKKEDFFFEKAGVEIPYKGYKFSKIGDGQYRVMKGSLVVGMAKDHQEAMKIADKHMASPYKGYKFKKAESGNYHVTKNGRFVGHAKSQDHAKQLADADMMKTEQTIDDLMKQYDLV